MKKFAGFLSVMCSVFGFEVVDAAKLSEQELLTWMAERKPEVLALYEGTVIPIRLFLDSEFFSVVDAEHSAIQVKKTLYVRKAECGSLIGSSLDELKDLDDFLGGQLSVAFRDGSLVVQASLHEKPKDEIHD